MKFETALSIAKDLFSREKVMGLRILAETEDDVKIINVDTEKRFELMSVYMALFSIKKVKQYHVLMEATMTLGMKPGDDYALAKKNNERRDVLIVMQVNKDAGHIIKVYDAMTLKEEEGLTGEGWDMKSDWTELFNVPAEFNGYDKVPKQMKDFMSQMWDQVYQSVDIGKLEK